MGIPSPADLHAQRPRLDRHHRLPDDVSEARRRV